MALDGITVYVNEKNAVEKLTFAQLKDIFQAAVKNWKEVGGKDAPIVLYGRENSSGTHIFFKEHVLKKEDYSVRVQPLPGTAAVVNAVAWVSHREDHHPQMVVGYDTCAIHYSTHSIGGLSENDFICAAKVDHLVEH